MKTIFQTRNRIITLIVGVFVALLPVGSGLCRASTLSIEEEATLGREFLTRLRSTLEFVEDDFAKDYINTLGHYLTGSVETKPFPFRFHIINDDTVNAFAGPGGQIFVYTGLVDIMDTMDELAGVLSHEIAHVSARHLARRMDKSKKVALASMAGVLAGILIGGDAAGAIMRGSMAAGVQAQLGYSRDDERQADQLGFRYISEAGIDPAGIIATLSKLQRDKPIGADSAPSYLLTHPGGAERLSNVRVMMSGYSSSGTKSREVVKYRKLFPVLKTILRANYLQPDETERIFSLELKKDPESISANFGLGLLWKKKSEHARAVEYLEKALLIEPKLLPILRHLGEAHQLGGQDEKAVRVFMKALEIDSNDSGTLFLLAKSYQNLEQYGRAITIYERLTAMEPVKADAFYNLGMSYGRQNRLALAHFNFGIYFKRKGTKKKAKFHFQKADDFARDDPALRRRVKKAMKDLM